jgi:hypothetical protein
MSDAINPEAGQPSSTLAYGQSDRNPAITMLGGTDADGGQVIAPASSESRVTQPGPALSPNAGLQNYNLGDIAEGVQDEAEREA